jgi:transcriptional regulator with XRE-family HTH domain
MSQNPRANCWPALSRLTQPRPPASSSVGCPSPLHQPTSAVLCSLGGRVMGRRGPGKSITADGETVRFGAHLRRARLRVGLSQAALAERSMLSTAAIAALESGRRTAPRPATVALLADALGLSPEERLALLETTSLAASTSPGSLAAATPMPSAPVLPIPPTPLIGREREEAALLALVRQPGPMGLVWESCDQHIEVRLEPARIVSARLGHPLIVYWTSLVGCTGVNPESRSALALTAEVARTATGGPTTERSSDARGSPARGRRGSGGRPRPGHRVGKVHHCQCQSVQSCA